MDGLFEAIGSFFDQLTTIAWAPLGLAVLCHLGRILSRSRAWRNIVAAAYPDTDVRWRDILGAYAAGIGANALVPGRGGDLLRLYLAKHRVEGATYPTLTATFLAEALFDFVVCSILIVWALSTGVLPGLDVLPNLPGIDWLWLFHNPSAALGIIFLILVMATVLTLFAAQRVQEFGRRVRQGLTILRDPPNYLRRVAAWQALDWVFRVTAIFFYLRAFGLPADAHNIFVVQVTQSLSTLLPLTPGGIGTEQALLVYLFRGTAASSDVLSFSVGVKLIVIVVNVTLGAIATFALLRTLRWRARVGEDAAERV
ncbi:MAG: flippase-like domain-containing protein [Actinomycetota bacterium]|nr:flippase-like domain-containing protein [Actinomycetota bacterium]